jgi:hypothetical protein
MLAQFDLGPLADLIFRLFQQIKQRGHGLAIDLEGLHQRAAFVGEAINPAMLVIAIGIANVVLHVADEGILPVENVQRAIGPDRCADGAEIGVGGGEQDRAGMSPEPEPSWRTSTR